MINNYKLVKEQENKYLKEEKLSYEQALAIYEAMWQEAKKLKILPSKDPLEGIEVDIRVAKILNSCLIK